MVSSGLDAMLQLRELPCAVHIRITGQMEENSRKIFPMGVGQDHEYENRDATA
jgi:hypothetical protein